MSESQKVGALLAMVQELRGLLLEYVAGGPARAPRYRELRDVLMGADQLSGKIPAMLIEHDNVSGLWQFLKYSLPSKIERQEFIRSEFDTLAGGLTGAAAPLPGSFEVIPSDKLFKGWYRLSQDEMESLRLLGTARKIAVQVCSSIVDAHYNSSEIRGGNEELSQVFMMVNDVLLACCVGTGKQPIVSHTIAGAVALLKSFDQIQAQAGLSSADHHGQRVLARMGVDAILSAVMSLLSCWYMLNPPGVQQLTSPETM